MKIFGEVNVLRGTVAWSRPLAVRLTPPVPELPAVASAPAPEYDEDGRLYVFRYARTQPQRCTIERDRIFDYLRRGRLPDAGQRQFRRDARNRADFFADVRELQLDSEVHEA